MARRLLPMYDLDKPVGPGKPNLAQDVRLIQQLISQLQQAGDFLMEGTTPSVINGVFSPALAANILTIQKNLRKQDWHYVTDGIVDPLPSKSGQTGDWDKNFANGVTSLMCLLDYRAFRINRAKYMAIGDTLSLPWAPDPFVI